MPTANVYDVDRYLKMNPQSLDNELLVFFSIHFMWSPGYNTHVIKNTTQHQWKENERLGTQLVFPFVIQRNRISILSQIKSGISNLQPDSANTAAAFCPASSWHSVALVHQAAQPSPSAPIKHQSVQTPSRLNPGQGVQHSASSSSDK